VTKLCVYVVSLFYFDNSEALPGFFFTFKQSLSHFSVEKEKVVIHK